MHGKILIIDGIVTNRIVLKVKLCAAFYNVVQAASIEEAVSGIHDETPDLIISAVQLPDGDVVRLARRVAGQTAGKKVPILAIGTDLNEADTLRLLSAGVSEVMRAPAADALLMAHVRCLLRSQAATQEWSIREDTTRALGMAEAAAEFALRPWVRLIAQDTLGAARWRMALKDVMDARICTAQPHNALDRLDPFSENPDGRAQNSPDIFMIALSGHDAAAELSLLSSLRTHAATRHAAILVLHENSDTTVAARALDLGADGLMHARFDADEMALRLQNLVERKRITDQLRATLRSGLRAAVSDPLTGLHNRLYAIPHLMRVAERAEHDRKSFAVMVADLDHFKDINDTYGHAAGDAVLVETSRRLREHLHGADMVARIGGEEFLIVMGNVGVAYARDAASRICRLISQTPFRLKDGRSITITISIGLTLAGYEMDGRAPGTSIEEHAHTLISRADQALYHAKTKGRNCVRLSRPAA